MVAWCDVAKPAHNVEMIPCSHGRHI